MVKIYKLVEIYTKSIKKKKKKKTRTLQMATSNRIMANLFICYE